MKIYVSHSKDLDFVNGLYKPIRESDLNNLHVFILPHEHGQHENNLELIKDSDLFIAEVSLPSTGQGIEIGWANTLKIPILCISKEGTHISKSLKYVTNEFIIYANLDDLILKISRFLSKMQE